MLFLWEKEPDMTKETLEARKAQLQQAHQQYADSIAQMQANQHGVEGAIGDCDYWLRQLNEASPAQTPPEAT